MANRPTQPLPRSLFDDVVERRRRGLYDRVLLPAGVPTPERIVCFQRAVGPDVSWAETNMIQSGFLPAPWDAILQRFVFVFQPGCDDGAVREFLKNYVFRFTVLQKILSVEPVLLCSVNAKMSDLIDGFGGEDCNGLVRPYCRRFSFDVTSELAIYIPPLAAFRLELEGASITPASDLDFFSVLDCSVDSPIQ
jgi:hypothetical protein